MAESHKKTVKKAAPAKEKAAAPKKKRVETPRVVEKPPVAAPVRAKKPSAPIRPSFYGTGRRKEATAKVRLTAGSGKMAFNGKSLNEYFCGRKLLEFVINRPFTATQTLGRYDVAAELLGGGVPAQADAVRMGIARALVVMNPALKPTLKKEGLLTRDPRMKERKKYGLKRARRAPQWQKR